MDHIDALPEKEYNLLIMLNILFYRLKYQLLD